MGSAFYTYILIAVMCLLLIGHYLPNMSQFRIVEGLTSNYQGYENEEKTDPLFLASKNAANISYLKSRLDEIGDLRKMVEDISGQVSLNSFNIKQIVDASSKKAESLTNAAASENLSAS